MAIGSASHILVLKPDEIGDVVLSTGFLRSLRRQCPQARITLAVKAACTALVKSSVFCDDIMEWDMSWFGGQRRAWQHYLGQIRERRGHSSPDWVLIPRGSGDHYHVVEHAWWTGASNICAHESLCLGLGKDLRRLVNHPVPSRGIQHEIELHGNMLAHVGLKKDDLRPELHLESTDIAAAAEYRTQNGLNGTIVALGIGAGDPARCWPVEKFAELIGRLKKANVPKILIIGGESDRVTGDALRKIDPSVVNAAGALALPVTAALLQHCRVFVGNDSGPMHLAAASGCRIIEISKHPITGDPASNNSPLRFGPVAAWKRILRPAFQHSGIRSLEFT